MACSKKLKILFFFLASGCTKVISPWQLDAIATGNRAFDSARLLYSDPQTSPLRLEILYGEEGIEGFVSLTKYKMHPSPDSLHVTLQCEHEGAQWRESIPLLEGGMRVRLSQETILRLIQSLQEDKKVTILVGGFAQTLVPEHFSELYQNLKAPTFIYNPLKGPLEL